MKWLDGIANSMDMSLSKLWEILKGRGSLPCCSPWGCKESDVTQQLNNKMVILRHMAGSDTGSSGETISPASIPSCGVSRSADM